MAGWSPRRLWAGPTAASLLLLAALMASDWHLTPPSASAQAGLSCPTIPGFEIAPGSGEVGDVGGNYQRFFTCRYFDADGGSSLHFSARWDWAPAPADAGAACGLPPYRGTLSGGNKTG